MLSSWDWIVIVIAIVFLITITVTGAWYKWRIENRYYSNLGTRRQEAEEDYTFIRENYYTNEHFCIDYISFILPGTRNGCKIQTGNNETRYCCSGYFEKNRSCHECIGSHGFNCSSPCPPSWYGALCRFRCSCPDDKCDRVNGCYKGPEKSNVQSPAVDSNTNPKAYALKAVDTYSPPQTTHVVTKHVKTSFQHGTKYVNTTFPHRIPQKFSLQDNSTEASLRTNIQEVIWKLQIRDWVVIFLIVLFAILATVIGVKMYQRKRERNSQFNYKRLAAEKQLNSEDFFFENDYSNVSMKTPVLTDCRV